MATTHITGVLALIIAISSAPLVAQVQQPGIKRGTSPGGAMPTVNNRGRLFTVR